MLSEKSQQRRKSKVMQIIKQLRTENIIEIKREEVGLWQCHICFNARIGKNDYKTNVVSFPDGSFMDICDTCMELCAKATFTNDCFTPRVGVICSEKYAEMVRKELAN